MTDSLCVDGRHHPLCASAAIFVTMPQCGEGDLQEVSVQVVNVATSRVRDMLQRAIDRWDKHMAEATP